MVYHELVLSSMGVMLGAGLHSAIHSSVQGAGVWALAALLLAAAGALLFARSLAGALARFPESASVCRLVSLGYGREWVASGQAIALVAETLLATALLTGQLASILSSAIDIARDTARVFVVMILVTALFKPRWSLAVQSVCSVVEIISCAVVPVVALALAAFGQQHHHDPTGYDTVETQPTRHGQLAWDDLLGFRHAVTSMTFAFGGLVCIVPMMSNFRAAITRSQFDRIMPVAVILVACLYAVNMAGYVKLLGDEASGGSLGSLGVVIAHALEKCGVTRGLPTQAAEAIHQAVRWMVDATVACSLLNGAMGAFQSASAESTAWVRARNSIATTRSIYDPVVVSCLVAVVLLLLAVPVASIMSSISALLYALYLVIHTVQRSTWGIACTLVLIVMTDDVMITGVGFAIYATLMIATFMFARQIAV
jgi:amino acid transporter